MPSVQRAPGVGCGKGRNDTLSVEGPLFVVPRSSLHEALPTNTSLSWRAAMRPHDPSFHGRDSRKSIRYLFTINCTCGNVFETARTSLAAVGEDRRARLNVICHERVQRRGRRIAAACGSGQALSAPGPPPRCRSAPSCPWPGHLPAPAAHRRCRSHPPPPCRLVGRGPGAPAPTAADAAWPTRSGRSRSRASASGSAPRSRLCPWRTASRHCVSGVRVRSKIVPAVTELRPPHPEHLKRPSPSRQPPSWPSPRKRSQRAIAATPSSPDSPHRCGTRPGTRPRTSDSACATASAYIQSG